MPELRLPVASPAPAGFNEAFADLYQRAHRCAFRLLGTEADAEDVAQEACARAMVRWRRLESPMAWTCRVATNLAIDKWRRRRFDSAHDGSEASSAAVDATRVDLHRALATLSRHQRDVVVARYIADLSVEQTAVALRMAEGTVKSHASRGLALLRVALGDSTPKEER